MIYFNKAIIMTSLIYLVPQIKSKAVWYTHRKRFVDVRIIQPILHSNMRSFIIVLIAK